MMTDHDKVIRGLESLETRLVECGDKLDASVVQNAIVLLKAQEPRLMTLEEVEAATGVDLYLEISTHADEIPYITAATLAGVGVVGVTFYCGSFMFGAYNKRIYGWRCWTSRPTDAQREAEPWDEEKLQ